MFAILVLEHLYRSITFFLLKKNVMYKASMVMKEFDIIEGAIECYEIIIK